MSEPTTPVSPQDERETLEYLKKVAEQATPRGEQPQVWFHNAHDGVRSKVHDGTHIVAITEPYGFDDPAGYKAMYNAIFIAAFNPQTALRLIEELARLRSEIATLRESRDEGWTAADDLAVAVMDAHGHDGKPGGDWETCTASLCVAARAQIHPRDLERRASGSVGTGEVTA